MDLLKIVEQPYLKDKLPQFDIGDNVDVHVKISEGEKERIQVFSGTVIARKGTGITQVFTVRRIVAGEGVERVFPLHSPSVTQVKVTRRGKVRRAKLYYLRDRVGKAVKVKERIGGLEVDAEASEDAEKKAKKRGKKVASQPDVKESREKLAVEREKQRKAKKESRKKAKDKPKKKAEA